MTFDAGLTAALSEVEQTMRDRQKKYGPDNINRHGILGIRVRLDDKLARIANGDADFTDESYRDAWVDVVGYGLIALMWLDETWPGQTTRPA